MAVAFVQGNQNSPGGLNASITVTLPSNTAGNLLVVGVQGGWSAKTSISDSAGNIWQTGMVGDYFGSHEWRLRLYYAENCVASAGTNTITVTEPAAELQEITIAEYSGVAASLAYSNGSQATFGLSTTLPVTNTDLVVALGRTLGGGMSAGAGMTARATAGGVLMLADGVASGTSFTAALSGSGEQNIIALALHASPPPSQGLYKGGDLTGSKGGAAGSYSESATFVANTAGNTLVAFLEVPDATTLSTVSLSDTAGNTWTLVTSIASGFAAYAVSSCVSSGKNVVTASMTLSGAAVILFQIAEYANAPLTASATSITGSASISAAVASSVGALVVACCRIDGTLSPGTGYTGRKTDSFMQIEDGTSSGATATAIFDISGSSKTLIVLSIGAPVTLPQVHVCVIT